MAKSKINPNVKCQISKQQFCHYFVICALSLVIFITGCARLKEGMRCVFGVSTKVLEDNRSTAVSRIFTYDYATCFDKSKEILGGIGAYFYKIDKADGLIAIYVSRTDTTPVGIFFKSMSDSITQVEVASPSSSAKALVSRRLFARLQGLPDPEETQAKSEEILSPQPLQTKRLEEENK